MIDGKRIYMNIREIESVDYIYTFKSLYEKKKLLIIEYDLLL